MPKANVSLVRASVAAYNAGDLDAALQFYAPDVEAFPDVSVFPDAVPLHGLGEYARWLEEIASAWTAVCWELEELFAVGEDRVVARALWGGEGVASGVRTTSSLTGVYTFREGRITRVEFYFDHEQALKAVGLEG